MHLYFTKVKWPKRRYEGYSNVKEERKKKQERLLWNENHQINGRWPEVEREFGKYWVHDPGHLLENQRKR